MIRSVRHASGLATACTVTLPEHLTTSDLILALPSSSLPFKLYALSNKSCLEHIFLIPFAPSIYSFPGTTNLFQHELLERNFPLLLYHPVVKDWVSEAHRWILSSAWWEKHAAKALFSFTFSFSSGNSFAIFTLIFYMSHSPTCITKIWQPFVLYI